VLDIRYFPENETDGLIDLVKKYMPRGYRCEAKVLVNTPSTYSSLSTRLYKAIERTIFEFGSKSLPIIQIWTSDSAWIRRLGIPVYHFMHTEKPLEVDRIHGADERIEKGELLNIVEGYYRLLVNL